MSRERLTAIINGGNEKMSDEMRTDKKVNCENQNKVCTWLKLKRHFQMYMMPEHLFVDHKCSSKKSSLWTSLHKKAKILCNNSVNWSLQ